VKRLVNLCRLGPVSEASDVTIRGNHKIVKSVYTDEEMRGREGPLKSRVLFVLLCFTILCLFVERLRRQSRCGGGGSSRTIVHDGGRLSLGLGQNDVDEVFVGRHLPDSLEVVLGRHCGGRRRQRRRSGVAARRGATAGPTVGREAPPLVDAE
jgi:hypothetical protein